MKFYSLAIPIAFIAFDVCTGWVKALATGTTNSSIMRAGLFRKLGEILAIAFGYGCEYAFPYVGVSIDLPLAAGIATYIVLMETASIVENLSAISPQLANALSKFFDTNKLNPDNRERGKHEKQSGDSGGSSDGEMG